MSLIVTANDLVDWHSQQEKRMKILERDIQSYIDVRSNVKKQESRKIEHEVNYIKSLINDLKLPPSAFGFSGYLPGEHGLVRYEEEQKNIRIKEYYNPALNETYVIGLGRRSAKPDWLQTEEDEAKYIVRDDFKQ